MFFRIQFSITKLDFERKVDEFIVRQDVKVRCDDCAFYWIATLIRIIAVRVKGRKEIYL